MRLENGGCKNRRRYSNPFARHLHIALEWSLVVIVEKRRACETLTTNEANLDLQTIACLGDNGSEPALDKVDEVYRLVDLFQSVFGWQVDAFEMRCQPLVCGVRHAL